MREYREPISMLPEFDRSKEVRQQRRMILPLVRKIIKTIVIDRPNEDMLAEIYFAGLWHGSELVRQRDLEPPPAPRKPDMIDVRQRRRLSQPKEPK